jgi:hypothetical protein
MESGTDSVDAGKNRLVVNDLLLPGASFDVRVELDFFVVHRSKLIAIHIVFLVVRL